MFCAYKTDLNWVHCLKCDGWSQYLDSLDNRTSLVWPFDTGNILGLSAVLNPRWIRIGACWSITLFANLVFDLIGNGCWWELIGSFNRVAFFAVLIIGLDATTCWLTISLFQLSSVFSPLNLHKSFPSTINSQMTGSPPVYCPTFLLCNPSVHNDLPPCSANGCQLVLEHPQVGKVCSFYVFQVARCAKWSRECLSLHFKCCYINCFNNNNSNNENL